MSAPVHGRGTGDNPANRFVRIDLDREDPDYVAANELLPEDDLPGRPRTEFYDDDSQSIIVTNDSPDIPFEASINPYRGCEHGCIYCYARPYHEYLGLSAGLDFETKIFVKRRAPELLREALMRPSWQPKQIAISGVTDCYQPVEARLKLTRGCLQVLAEFRNPTGLITKNALVLRDLDLLQDLARHNAAGVALSITTLDEALRVKLEPRTSTGLKRLEALKRLNDAGVPAGVMVAPIIPGLNDHEMIEILKRAADAGAKFAGTILLRLPHGLAPLFEQWLSDHFPLRRDKVLARIHEARGGRVNDPRFGSRMRGEGFVADSIARMFELTREKVGIPAERPPLSTAAFRRPGSTKAMF